MEFHLLYSGQLHSGGYANPRAEKHAIRKVFHKQLKHLWEVHPNLRELAVGQGHMGPGTRLSSVDLDDESLQKGALQMARHWNQNGFNFLPLVTERLCLRCSLDILFLRAEGKNYVLQGGDIDGRLKTLFDALRIVRDANELPAGANPESREDPFFCLLENDDLISDVRVNTDRLLSLPEKTFIDKHDVYLQIGVRLASTRKTWYSWVFE